MRLMDHAVGSACRSSASSITPGAYAGVLAEEQGQGEAIAVNLRRVFPPAGSGHRHTVIAKGGSRRRPRIGVGRDRLLSLKHSVLQPWPARKLCLDFVERCLKAPHGGGS